MNGKELLAQATKKLESHKPASAPPVSVAPKAALLDALEAKAAETPTEETKTASFQKKEEKQGSAPKAKGKDGPTQKKGITLRPGNLRKLDDLELSLRKQGVKANHSGLIQIAIEKLQNNSELVEAYRELLKQDLRFR